jgi:scyllo-inositol 2-dehydrogenase (NADP+)
MIDVGLIGFGLAGRAFHAPVIRAVQGLRLAAIVKRNGDEAAEAYPDVKIVRSVDELLAVPSIRLIVIATPNQTHFPLAKLCLESGRDVVVDKPFTTSIDEALKLFHTAREHGRLVTAYHNRRFDADFQALREVLKQGTLGRVVRFESHYDRFRPTPKSGAWRETPGPGSGVLFDLGPHLIDHALTLFGSPEQVSADVRIERTGMATDDAFDLTFYYRDSLRAKLQATMLCATPRPRFLVLGEQGTFVKQSFDPLENQLRLGQVPQGDSWVLEKAENWGQLTVIEEGKDVVWKIPSEGDWRQFYLNVRDAILGKEELIVTPQQILNVMVGLELAQESNAQRRTLPWRIVPWRTVKP